MANSKRRPRGVRELADRGDRGRTRPLAATYPSLWEHPSSGALIEILGSTQSSRGGRLRSQPGLTWPLLHTAIGVAALLGSIGFAGWRYSRLAQLEHVDGVVVAHRQGNDDATYYVVEFLPPGRQAPVRVESWVNDVDVRGVGGQVGVYYDRGDPTKALLDTPVELWFLPALIGGLAAFFAIPTGLVWLGVIVALRRRSGSGVGSWS
jgi:hypothetical protein